MECKEEAEDSLTKNSVDRIHGHLVLGGITNEPLSIGEGNIGRSGSIALIVGNDLHAIMLPHPHTGIGRAEVDPNCWAIFTGSHGRSSVEGNGKNAEEKK